VGHAGARRGHDGRFLRAKPDTVQHRFRVRPAELRESGRRESNPRSLLENMVGGSSRWLAGTISVGEPPNGLVDPCIGPTTSLKGGEFQ